MTDWPPIFRAHLFFCTNQRPDEDPRGCCANHQSVPLAQYLKTRVKEVGLKRVRVNTTGCLDRCSLGPVLVIYPEGVWYSFANQTDLDDILETHLIGGQRVDRLLLPDLPASAGGVPG
jgi:(2Fe-2S) ferredoxin